MNFSLSSYFDDMTSDQEKATVLDGDVSPIGIAKKFSTFKNVIVLCGAGISTSAGIPDFRSAGTGLYDNLQKYKLPEPESIFDIRYFRSRPEAFCLLAKELFPGKFQPTLSHRFIKLLSDRGMLLRNYTQNIDGLEDLVGIPEDRLVQAHGHFKSAHCIDCGKESPVHKVKESLDQDAVPHCTSCGGYVKPDIVFFGESLPDRFFRLSRTDFEQCDLLIVMGTSLVVQPFASLINKVGPLVPRLLINRELAGSFEIDSPQNYRDAALLGDIDQKVVEFMKMARLEFPSPPNYPIEPPPPSSPQITPASSSSAASSKEPKSFLQRILSTVYYFFGSKQADSS